ncbi:hypothetical protein ACWGI8_18785 [Streptomyces sp. NPDC054841]
MPDTPAVTANGYCTNTTPAPGTLRTLNANAAGPKFFRLHGRRYADCPCGRAGIGLTERGNLHRHKPPQA